MRQIIFIATLLFMTGFPALAQEAGTASSNGVGVAIVALLLLGFFVFVWKCPSPALFLGGILLVIGSCLLTGMAKSAIHEILAGVVFLAAMISIVGAVVIKTIAEISDRQIEQGKTGKTLPADHSSGRTA